MCLCCSLTQTASGGAKSGDIDDNEELSIESVLAELIDFPPRLIQLIQHKVQPVTFKPAEDVLKMREPGSGFYFLMTVSAASITSMINPASVSFMCARA